MSHPPLAFILFSHLLPQIRSLRRERVETVAEKEELVDDPMENGTLHSPPDLMDVSGVERL